MSGQHADLPMYAAPHAPSTRTPWRATPTRVTSLVDTWVPYGRIVARDHPWFDRSERALNEFRLLSQRYQVRVTEANAPICLRVALPADELAVALTRVAGLGAIEIGDCRLSLDAASLHNGDEKAIKVIEGSLSMPWMLGRLDVRAAARPWSSTRADLVLTPARHRLHYPRRWFTVGFALADELRRLLSAAPPQRIGGFAAETIESRAAEPQN
ncbi:MAG TPA: hypothetical protein VM282_27150 [Acidimicrobiales bacterium]|nr:hypothetical protein [Acidimicrobiales bacterium]